MSEKSSAILPLPLVPVEVYDGIPTGIALEVMRNLYGLHAATAAAWCAIEARSDGIDDQYRFWFGLFCELRKTSPVFSLLPHPIVKIDRSMVEGDYAQKDDTIHDNLNRFFCSQNLRHLIVRQIRSIVGN
ncbi:hypothetical protein [Agrobacterium sp. Azo12]|uniref:hypothetical protein n=1 Tax=Agrobacterium sp. Azo12 TaxID=3031129 RepID=UPI0023D8974F|nr:hypothetical protein [Agrobacterium sp. Azo12]MDO5896989.1 hypothetical protein [Agrobacterium sp. Azo12]